MTIATSISRARYLNDLGGLVDEANAFLASIRPSLEGGQLDGDAMLRFLGALAAAQERYDAVDRQEV